MEKVRGHFLRVASTEEVAVRDTPWVLLFHNSA
jgi:hypothetical protein